MPVARSAFAEAPIHDRQRETHVSVAAGSSTSADALEPFSSPEVVRRRLAGYLADDRVAGVVSLAARLGKPILVEGPAGTGKTQLAKSVAAMSSRALIRLQCYEGIDESKALYEWDYRK
jgi:MoxR-like ATPase